MGELEGSANNPESIDQARRLTTRLQMLAEEFKVHHYAVIDLIEDEGDLAKEQETLDNFDSDVAQLITRLERLASRKTSTDSNLSKIATKRLKHLQRGLSSVSDNINSLLRTTLASFSNMKSISPI